MYSGLSKEEPSDESVDLEYDSPPDDTEGQEDTSLRIEEPAESPKRAELKIVSIEEDIREITPRSVKRALPADCYWSLTKTSGSENIPSLFVEGEAVGSLLEFVDWGKRTGRNSLEQAAFLYGHLCEFTEGGRSIRWGEVCGIIEMKGDIASDQSISIPAEEWARAGKELDSINKPIIEHNEQGYVPLGWVHTHPGPLDPYFSRMDIELQSRIMNNRDLFGLVLNPHRQIFACYKDGDSKPCGAVFAINEDLRRYWNFSEEPLEKGAEAYPIMCVGHNQFTDEAPVLTLRSNRRVRYTFYVLDSAFHLTSFDQTKPINEKEFTFIFQLLKKVEKQNNPTVAVIRLSAARINHSEYKPELIAVIPEGFAYDFRAKMGFRWEKYFYLVKLYSGVNRESGIKREMLDLSKKGIGYFGINRFMQTDSMFPVILLDENETPFYVHIMNIGKE